MRTWLLLGFLAAPVVLGAAGEPPVRGAATAATEIVVFADLTQTAAGNAFVVLDAFARAHADTLRLVFRHNPKADTIDAVILHRILAAAHAQGRFWEFARLVAANQERLAAPDLFAMAAQAGLDPAQLSVDANAAASGDAVALDVAEAASRGATGPVRVFVNGRALEGPLTRSALEKELHASR